MSGDKHYTTHITKSRSGHYTLTLRSKEFPGVRSSLEKLASAEMARLVIPSALRTLDAHIAHLRFCQRAA